MVIDAINVVIVDAVMDACLQRRGTISRVALTDFQLASEAKKIQVEIRKHRIPSDSYSQGLDLVDVQTE